MFTEENGKYQVACDEEGVISIKNKENEDINVFRLFNDKFQYLYEQWWVEPRLFLAKKYDYLIVTYGIGHVYLIELKNMEIVRRFQLFPEISYEDDSYQKIDTGCYYHETTEVDFSASEKYAVIRVRGDYDPQESDGRKELFTPIYFSSVYLLDLQTLEIVFHYDGNDMEEQGYNKNMAVIAMNPSESQLLVGALGNDLKLFDIKNTYEIQTFKGLAWRGDPCDVRKCPFAVFINDNNLAYLNTDYNIAVYTKREDAEWSFSQIIDTDCEVIRNGEKRKCDFSRLEYDKYTKEFICDSKLRYKIENLGEKEEGNKHKKRKLFSSIIKKSVKENVNEKL